MSLPKPFPNAVGWYRGLAAILTPEAVTDRVVERWETDMDYLMAPPAPPAQAAPVQLLTREGPTADEVQIIGVELAYTPYDTGREVELEMFACQHTLPAAHMGQYGTYDRYPGQVRVTLHTSAGDVTLRGYGERF